MVRSSGGVVVEHRSQRAAHKRSSDQQRARAAAADVVRESANSSVDAFVADMSVQAGVRRLAATSIFAASSPRVDCGRSASNWSASTANLRRSDGERAEGRRHAGSVSNTSAKGRRGVGVVGWP
jgi:hypothetical protein